MGKILRYLFPVLPLLAVLVAAMYVELADSLQYLFAHWAASAQCIALPVAVCAVQVFVLWAIEATVLFLN